MHKAERFDAIWRVASPKEWPLNPTWFSVTGLLGIEKCPRQWALSRAKYIHLPDAERYPSRPSISSLAGVVVHQVIERITEALSQAGCKSVMDPRSVSILQDLGGYTQITRDSISSSLTLLRANPRGAHLEELIGSALYGRVAKFRTDIQNILRRLSLADGGTRDRHRRSENKTKLGNWKTLADGANPEVSLSASGIRMTGQADLVNKSTQTIEIIEFKSGMRRDEHRFQIKVYELLWNRDRRMNPSQTPVNRLVISYPDGDLIVQPSTYETLASFELELAERQSSALKSLEDDPPLARPSLDACGYCEVRHLCDVYWNKRTQDSLALDRASSDFVDAELVVSSRVTDLAFEADLVMGQGFMPGTKLIVVSTNYQPIIQAGDRIRILGARVVKNNFDFGVELPKIELTPASEIFFVY